jgi:hypothetical protein
MDVHATAASAFLQPDLEVPGALYLQLPACP